MAAQTNNNRDDVSASQFRDAIFSMPGPSDRPAMTSEIPKCSFENRVHQCHAVARVAKPEERDITHEKEVPDLGRNDISYLDTILILGCELQTGWDVEITFPLNLHL
jgi:hypothetical protein